MTMMTVRLHAPLPLVVLVVLVEATARRARAFSTHRLGFAATTARGWSTMTLRLVVRQHSGRVRSMMTFHWLRLRFVGVVDRVPVDAAGASVGRLGKELRQRDDLGRRRFRRRRRRGEGQRRFGIVKSTNDPIGAQPVGPTTGGSRSRRWMGALVPRGPQARWTKLIRRHKTRTIVHLPLLLKKQYTRR